MLLFKLIFVAFKWFYFGVIEREGNRLYQVRLGYFMYVLSFVSNDRPVIVLSVNCDTDT